MARKQVAPIIVVGAGAAGLMVARELARAGRPVTILEARDRCGGRIHPLPEAGFGYAAEGGAEFVHGEAPVTRGLLREAGLSLLPLEGRRWRVRNGKFTPDEPQDPHQDELHDALQALRDDLTVAEFLRRHFAGSDYEPLRREILRMVEGYDAADPERASTLALRDEWMGGDHRAQGRIAGGYGALSDFLLAECRRHRVAIHLGATVAAVEASGDGAVVRCVGGGIHHGDAVVLTVPLPLLDGIALPPADRARAAAAAEHIGFGNVIKLLLRFDTAWWLDHGNDVADLMFLLSEETIPVWWTHPAGMPVLTGWFGGPRTEALRHLGEPELIDAGLGSLASIFGRDPSQLKQKLVAARALDWARDPHARGAYSWATPQSRAAQAELSRNVGGVVLFSGEALYRGKDMGTVEAALASGLETARTLLG